MRKILIVFVFFVFSCNELDPFPVAMSVYEKLKSEDMSVYENIMIVWFRGKIALIIQSPSYTPEGELITYKQCVLAFLLCPDESVEVEQITLDTLRFDKTRLPPNWQDVDSKKALLNKSLALVHKFLDTRAIRIEDNPALKGMIFIHFVNFLLVHKTSSVAIKDGYWKERLSHSHRMAENWYYIPEHYHE